jgi:hypothetical protein
MINIATEQDVDLYQIDPDQLDQENRLKLELQKMLPAVRLMRIKAGPGSLMGLERDQTLKIMGFGQQEIAEMTGFRCERKADLDLDQEPELIILGRDFPDKLKEMEDKHRREWEEEEAKMLEFGMRLGFIEEELGREVKL